MRAFTLAAGLAITAAVTVPALASGPSATPQASDLCQEATATGTLVGMFHVGPVCVPYNHANLCQTETVGFEPWAEVTAKACVPAVIAKETSDDLL
jgi:hypothetical protein